MSDKPLTKRDALDLITPVVDGEVDTSTRQAFLEYIKDNKEIRRQYESEKRIKNLTASRCPYFNAPDSLKSRIHKFIHNQQFQDETLSRNQFQDYQSQSISEAVNEKDYSTSLFAGYENWIYATAASFLVILACWGLVLSGQFDSLSYNIEQYAYEHFMKNKGGFIDPSISTASLTKAEIALSDNFDFPMIIPPVKNAEFKGVVYSDFVPDYKSPLLEYYQPNQDQFIYIFAFKINQLKEYGRLIRSEQAIKQCLRPQDFHVTNVNGKHVVSWKWNDIWYTAISNHNGEELASLVEPLNFTSEN